MTAAKTVDVSDYSPVSAKDSRRKQRNTVLRNTLVIKSYRITKEQAQFLDSLDNASEFIRTAINLQWLKNVAARSEDKLLLLSSEVMQKEQEKQQVETALEQYKETMLPEPLKKINMIKDQFVTDIKYIFTGSRILTTKQILKIQHGLYHTGKPLWQLQDEQFTRENSSFRFSFPRALFGPGDKQHTESELLNLFINHIDQETKQVNTEERVAFWKIVRAYEKKIEQIDQEIADLKKNIIET